MENVVEKIREFHGHEGIWAAIGYMAGRMAKNILQPEKPKHMEALVKIPPESNHYCVLDGVQISSCCTMGKRNIIVEDSKNDIEFCFKNKQTRNEIKFLINDNILNNIENSDNDCKNAKWVLSRTNKELFTIISS